MTDEHYTMIKTACAQWNLDILGWDSNEAGYEFALLGKAVTLDDLEMAQADEEGTMTAQVVGAKKYNNEQVKFYFTPEGMDIGDECYPSQVDFL